jgi:DNA-binding NtrC family response regulator
MLSNDPKHRLTVLLADEDGAWVPTMRTLLAPQGVQTVAARTGRQALELIEGGSIHVAVLDQRMPQLSGMQVVKRMRDLPAAPPAILLADHLTNHLLQEALGMRVFSVLGKPVDFNLLLDCLARVLRRYHQSRWPKE